MGVVKTRAGRARRGAEHLGDLGRGVVRGSGEARGSPAARVSACGTPVPAGRDRPAEEVVRRRRSVDREARGDWRPGDVRGVAWSMHTFASDRWIHASNRSGSRRPGRSRQAITSASCRASSARSTSRRIRCAIANRRSTRGADQVDECRPDRHAAPNRRGRGPRHRPCVALVGSAVHALWPPMPSKRSKPADSRSILVLSKGRVTEEAMELYPWFVFVHLAGLVLFAISHGASAFMAFRVRRARIRRRSPRSSTWGNGRSGPCTSGCCC